MHHADNLLTAVAMLGEGLSGASGAVESLRMYSTSPSVWTTRSPLVYHYKAQKVQVHRADLLIHGSVAQFEAVEGECELRALGKSPAFTRVSSDAFSQSVA